MITRPKPKTTSKLKLRFQFVFQHIRKSERPDKKTELVLAEDHWLEKLDPLHRPIHFLSEQHKIWKQQATTTAFFPWLNQKNSVSDQKQTSQVEYNSEAEGIKKYKVTFKNGIIYDNQNQIFDTSTLKGKATYTQFAAFVFTKKGELLIAEHKHEKFQHSSFIGGDNVMCAGMIKVIKGKIVDISNVSGHYRPHALALANALKTIPENVFAKDCMITFENAGLSLSRIKKEDFLKHIIGIHTFFPALEKIRMKNIAELDASIAQYKQKTSVNSAQLRKKIEAILNQLKSIANPGYDLEVAIKKAEEAITPISEEEKKCILRH